MITIATTLGEIKIELDSKNTPKTTENFLQYMRDGFFTDTIFHRVINGFMIQGGGLTADLSKKETRDPIENEAELGGLNKRGTIAMARTNEPHSATAQFFINVADNAFLDFRGKSDEQWGYCVFGEVVDGMDVVDQIKAAKTTYTKGHDDVPEEPIVITAVTES